MTIHTTALARPAAAAGLRLPTHWLQLAWILASVVGGLLFEAVSSLNLAWAAVLLGVLLGLPQWPLLRLYLPRASRWIIASGLAMVLAWFAGFVASVVCFVLAAAAGALLPAPLRSALAPLAPLLLLGPAAAAGAAYGLVQEAFVLGDAAPGSWRRASALAAPAFWLVLIGLHLPFGGLQSVDPLVHLGSGAAGGLAYGLITGRALSRLLGDAPATL